MVNSVLKMVNFSLKMMECCKIILDGPNGGGLSFGGRLAAVSSTHRPILRISIEMAAFLVLFSIEKAAISVPSWLVCI